MNHTLLALFTILAVITQTPAANAWPALTSPNLFCELVEGDVKPEFASRAGWDGIRAFHLYKAEGRTFEEWHTALCPPEKTIPMADVLRTAAAKEEAP